MQKDAKDTATHAKNFTVCERVLTVEKCDASVHANREINRRPSQTTRATGPIKPKIDASTALQTTPLNNFTAPQATPPHANRRHSTIILSKSRLRIAVVETRFIWGGRRAGADESSFSDESRAESSRGEEREKWFPQFLLFERERERAVLSFAMQRKSFLGRET